MTTVFTPLAALHLADGPAMYFGGTIETFTPGGMPARSLGRAAPRERTMRQEGEG